MSGPVQVHATEGRGRIILDVSEWEPCRDLLDWKEARRTEPMPFSACSAGHDDHVVFAHAETLGEQHMGHKPPRIVEPVVDFAGRETCAGGPLVGTHSPGVVEDDQANADEARDRIATAAMFSAPVDVGEHRATQENVRALAGTFVPPPVPPNLEELREELARRMREALEPYVFVDGVAPTAPTHALRFRRPDGQPASEVVDLKEGPEGFTVMLRIDDQTAREAIDAGVARHSHSVPWLDPQQLAARLERLATAARTATTDGLADVVAAVRESCTAEEETALDELLRRSRLLETIVDAWRQDEEGRDAVGSVWAGFAILIDGAEVTITP